MRIGTEEIDLSADTVSVDEVLLRLDYLEGLEPSEMTSEEEAELGHLSEVKDKLEGFRGEYLIADSYFEQHARELAEDCSGVDFTVWPATCIDWDTACELLQADYVDVEIDGYEFWVRG